MSTGLLLGMVSKDLKKRMHEFSKSELSSKVSGCAHTNRQEIAIALINAMLHVSHEHWHAIGQDSAQVGASGST